MAGAGDGKNSPFNGYIMRYAMAFGGIRRLQSVERLCNMNVQQAASPC